MPQMQEPLLGHTETQQESIEIVTPLIHHGQYFRKLPQMVNIRIKNLKGRKYAYVRARGSDGRMTEKYLDQVKRTSHPGGIHCARCGKRIDDLTIRAEIISRLKEAREKMWKEKRHISNYAQYELLGTLIDAFSGME